MFLKYLERLIPNAEDLASVKLRCPLANPSSKEIARNFKYNAARAQSDDKRSPSSNPESAIST